MKMKDYLNREQKNQLMTIMALVQQMEGKRTVSEVRIEAIWKDWKERNFLTTEESKSIKTAHTHLEKFCNLVLSRINVKEREMIIKQLLKFDFKIIDDYTLDKLFRDMKDATKFAVVPRNQFDDWCCEIMECRCRGCDKHWDGCDLYKVFEDNFVLDGGHNRDNCIYSYK